MYTFAVRSDVSIKYATKATILADVHVKSLTERRVNRLLSTNELVSKAPQEHATVAYIGICESE